MTEGGATGASAVVLRADGLEHSFGAVRALDGLSFEVSAGELYGLIGADGAGKSSLFKVLSGVLQPASGKVRVFGAGPSRHICISYLPQRSQVDWNFPATVADVVLMGRVAR